MYNMRIATVRKMTRKWKEAELYKMPKGFVTGTKRMRGQPILYEEVKKKLNLNLTPTAISIIKKIAGIDSISCSELVERWAREKGCPDS